MGDKPVKFTINKLYPILQKWIYRVALNPNNQLCMEGSPTYVKRYNSETVSFTES